MNIFKAKRRVKSERSTSSGSWRKLAFRQLGELTELKALFCEELIYIYELVTTLDTENNYESMLKFIASGDIKSLVKMQGKFPFDYDEMDYPSLSLVLLKTQSNQYLIIYSESEDFKARKTRHIVVDNFICKDTFDTRKLIYPL